VTDAPDPDEELAEGRAFLEEGDLDEALMRAARAVAVAPQRHDVLAFADEVLARHPSPLPQLVLSDDVPYGIVAMRARALARRARLLEATDLAIQLSTFRPALDFGPWAAEWLSSIPTEIRATEADQLLARIVAYAKPLLGSSTLDPALRANATAMCEILARIEPLVGAPAKASYLRTSLLRRLGRTEEALALAQEAYVREPSWLSAVEVASAFRDASRWSEAAEWYRRAATHDPKDSTAWTDLGRVLMEAGDFIGSERAFERALAIVPRHPRALAGLAEARRRRTGG
jgi:tetratricopeptide (TPR) repeat protein